MAESKNYYPDQKKKKAKIKVHPEGFHLYKVLKNGK